ncbi:nucleoporin Ndc1-like [Ischnura elegans]|uniref:nucleoporin Ndc1-like n=1 Tax=Ischnura elegans TaxID=197161 RepID=UPI001ED890F0|nr:nucleoporin Ndc1-like [Ischnura elegans]
MAKDEQLENRSYVLYKLRRGLTEGVVFGTNFVAFRVFVAALVNSATLVAYLILYLSIVNFNIFEPFYIYSTISEFISSFDAVLYTNLLGIFITVVFFLTSRDFVIGVSYVKTPYDFVKHVFTGRFTLLNGFVYVAIGYFIASLYLVIHGKRFEPEFVMCGLVSDQYCWNSGHLYLLIYGSLTGLYYFVTERLRIGKALLFPTLRLSKFALIRSRVKRELMNLMFDFKWGTLMFVPIYAWLTESIQCSSHRNVITCVESERHGSHCLMTKELDTVGRNPYWDMILGSFVICTSFVVVMHTVDSIIWIFLTERAKFDIQPSLWETNKYTLSDAMASPKFPVIRYMAFYDFAFLTECEPERRRKIFNVSSNGGNPRNWRGIYIECVELINEFINSLENAMKGEEDFVIPQELVPSIPEPEMEEPLYIPPDVVRNLTGNVEVKYHRTSFKKTVMENLRLWMRIVLIKFWSSKFVRWLFMKCQNAEMDILIEQQWQPVSWAVQGLASLVHHSPLEDKYGVIQPDICNLVDILLKLKSSLDDSLGQNSASPFHGQNSACENVRLRMVMEEIITFSLSRIAFACKNHLPSVVLPSDKLSKLKEFTGVS